MNDEIAHEETVFKSTVNSKVKMQVMCNLFTGDAVIIDKNKATVTIAKNDLTEVINALDKINSEERQ